MIPSPEKLTPAMQPTLLWSKADLARELRTSIKTVDRMDAAGKLPRAVRVGTGKRWDRSTIVRWVAAGCPCRRDFEALEMPRGSGT